MAAPSDPASTPVEVAELNFKIVQCLLISK